MKFELTKVWGFEHAIRGMRNPYKSHDKSDSIQCHYGNPEYCAKCPWSVEDGFGCMNTTEIRFMIGPADLALCQKLIKAGGCHRKFMRQIMVSVDITASEYWWSQFDTYKVGTVSNSESKMHKLADTPITAECFEFGSVIPQSYIETLESKRQIYNKTKLPYQFEELLTMLPLGWLQKRTITMDYENILQMVEWRSGHKLSGWSKHFIGWAHSLPYADELLFLKESSSGSGTGKDESPEKTQG